MSLARGIARGSIARTTQLFNVEGLPSLPRHFGGDSVSNYSSADNDGIVRGTNTDLLVRSDHTYGHAMEGVV
jgi:hypothetical protein